MRDALLNLTERMPLIDVKFFVEKETDTWKVSRVSTVKACHCPRGKKPCTMDP